MIRPCLHHARQIGAAHRRQPVGDDQRRAAFGELGERLLDQPLGFRIERARGLVEQQQRRIHQDRARKREALALAARQLQSAIADDGVVAVGLIHDEIVGRRGARGSNDLGVGRAEPPERDVGADRVVEEGDVLTDHRDSAAQARDGHLADVLPIDEDAAAIDIEQARHKVDQRRLAGARTPDEGDDAAAGNGEIDVVERAAGIRSVVAEAHVFETHIALGDDQRQGAGGIDDARLLVEQVIDALGGREAFLDARRNVAERANRL